MTEEYTSTRIPVSKLLLDPQNPRLPEELLGKPQSDLLEWLEVNSNLEEIASSMLQSGFFEHEPLIVKSTDGEGDQYIVVEGNRRFATISILLQLPPAKKAQLAFEFDNPLRQSQANPLNSVPCVVVNDDNEVRRFLGFRHIGGIKTWSAEAKARYIVAEVEATVRTGSSNPFREVGKRVGTNAVGVRGPYIALKTIHAARELPGLSGLSSRVLRERFGVWNRLLNSAEVRSFIGLGEALDYDSVSKALGTLDPANLESVLRDLVPEDGAKIAVLQDSRDVTTYGQVIANDSAREALFAYRDLGLAAQIADGSSLPARVKRISSSVELLMRIIDSFEIGSKEVDAVSHLNNSVRSLSAIVKDRLDGND